MTSEALDRAQSALADLLNEYENALADQADAEQALKTATQHVDSLQEQIINQIMNIEDQFGIEVSASSDRFKYTIARKSYWRIPAAEKDGAIRSSCGLRTIRSMHSRRRWRKCGRHIRNALEQPMI